jgi:replicative DNA helicase
MKIYPKLEAFTTNLAYCAILEEPIADIAAAAGIDWRWPKTFAGDAVIEFQDLVAKIGRERALVKMRSVIAMLEAQTQKLSEMPSDIESLRAAHKILTRYQRALDFANLVKTDPESFERHLSLIDDHAPSSSVRTTDMRGVVSAYSAALEKINRKEGIILIPGFEKISTITGGFNPGRVTFVLADTGFGKSNLSLNLAFAATQRMAVAYLNLELCYEDIAKRIATMRSKKTWADLNNGRIAVDEMHDATRHEIRISDGSELHVDSIIAWARAFKREHPSFGLLVIDYDQKIELTTGREAPEWRAMQIAVRALEDEAKRQGYHVILVAQLNREGDISSSHRAVFTAHTVLSFRLHENRPIVDNRIKHRHAKGPCGVNVQYTDDSPLVREMPADIFYLGNERAERAEAKAQSTKGLINKFNGVMGGRI